VAKLFAMENRETGDTAKIAHSDDAQRGRIPADTFSNRLLLSRALAGHISIREACERTGLNRGNWQEWERGRRPQDILDVARTIADTLDIDFNWLLLGGPLENPRGRPVRKSTERIAEDTPSYTALASRPTSNRPKVRTDQRSPISYPTAGRRPVRVGRADTPMNDHGR
jgi:transcriptional regulator with XRE-family HTH domain